MVPEGRECTEELWTDWRVLQESFGQDIEGVTNCTTDYLNFCIDNSDKKEVWNNGFFYINNV